MTPINSHQRADSQKTLFKYWPNHAPTHKMLEEILNILGIDPWVLKSSIVFHEKQTRADQQTPYIIHPMGVVKILFEEGSVKDPVILHAALLHDTLEDTQATPRDIQFTAGPSVLSIVKELTHAPISQFMAASPSAKIIKLADRIYNLRDLTNGNFPKKEIDDYYNSSRELLEAIKGSHPVLEELLLNQILQGLKLK